ncbi:hypothetical protein B296_00026099 [Ensete ventricosum]|uniref:Secreted protein n=1 Tax=Ensete ventricosum TaxID=4639 RepID=A0A427ASB4_ENSVE|nr:hypothetical protein B296_00026099 [Ensete ventricosum]
MTAHKIWVLCMATLRLSSVSWWYSCVPCEKLNLATFMPALSSFSSIGTDLDAGPSVHTIFVFGTRPSLGSSLRIPSMSMFAILPQNPWTKSHTNETDDDVRFRGSRKPIKDANSKVKSAELEIKLFGEQIAEMETYLCAPSSSGFTVASTSPWLRAEHRRLGSYLSPSSPRESYEKRECLNPTAGSFLAFELDRVTGPGASAVRYV